MSEELFTSESVASGHPDKLCDAISDAIVDACLTVDRNARVAVETSVKGGKERGIILLAGEVTLSEPSKLRGYCSQNRSRNRL